eukprot:3252238-Lingulodinium_polyedra.AAC.1
MSDDDMEGPVDKDDEREEDQGQPEEEDQECSKAEIKVATNPSMPTKREREEHRAAFHVPFRS